MNETPAFYKYVGVQGVLAILLVIGYIYAAVSEVNLIEGYTEITTFTLGFYFAKNGVGIVKTLRTG